MDLPRARYVWIAAVVALGALGAVAAYAAPAHATPAPRDSADISLPTPEVRHWQVGLLRPDRIQHASLSLTVGLAVGLLTRRPALAAGSGIALGLAKELYDIRGSGFDVLDLCADTVGSGAAAYGTRAIED
jgi:hypothetical protein